MHTSILLLFFVVVVVAVVYLELREAKHELGANNKGTEEDVPATMHRNNGSKKTPIPTPRPPNPGAKVPRS